jgi:phage terminase large subunit-like protein
LCGIFYWSNVMTHPSIQYADDVLSGKVLACRWVKLACQRFLDDLEHGHERGLFFDVPAADHALEFFSHLKLWKGKEYKGLEFTLAPHYQFILSNIMGWKNEDGTRRFRTAYIEMARKGAKSTFAGGLGAYFFIADGEDGAEIYTAAVKEKQAKIVWQNISNLTKKSMFAPMIQYSVSNLSIEDTWSKCEFVVGDPKGLDGLDTHFASLDELHAHPTPAVHDLIDDSMGTRSQPLLLIITTAGFDQSGVCYQRREYLTKILKGFNDDSFFGVIYTLDRQQDWPELKTADEYRNDQTGEIEDDWSNEDLWVKSMPGLCGITKNGIRYGVDAAGEPLPGYMTKLESVRKKAKYAMEIPAAQNNFLCKRLNIWTSQSTRWISLDVWDSNYTGEVYVIE